MTRESIETSSSPDVESLSAVALVPFLGVLAAQAQETFKVGIVSFLSG